jgi:L-seryl-tRNA(Ser) seleniumtransferase
VDAYAVDSAAAVGGGGAPGVNLPSAAVSLPEWLAVPLRLGEPAILGRVADGRLLLDLHALPSTVDTVLHDAVMAAR